MNTYVYFIYDSNTEEYIHNHVESATQLGALMKGLMEMYPSSETDPEFSDYYTADTYENLVEILRETDVIGSVIKIPLYN